MTGPVRGSDRRPAGRRLADHRLALRGLGLGALVLAADQCSKAWMLYGLHLPERRFIRVFPVLDWIMVWNHAVTFGMLAGVGGLGRYLFSVVSVVIVGLLLWWMLRTPRPVVAAALGAIAGGAIGNVVDRLRFGAVVDFIHVHLGSLSWDYIFNVGDAAIVCGVSVLVLDGLFERRAAPAAAGPAD